MLTAQSPSYQYQVGGSLPLDAPSYVRRQADWELYKALLSIKLIPRLKYGGLDCVPLR